MTRHAAVDMPRNTAVGLHEQRAHATVDRELERVR
jgi:hypothetical protein